MKRGGQPKTLVSSSSGAWPEASDTVAERLADWQQNLSDQVSLFFTFLLDNICSFLCVFYLEEQLSLGHWSPSRSNRRGKYHA